MKLGQFLNICYSFILIIIILTILAKAGMRYPDDSEFKPYFVFNRNFYSFLGVPYPKSLNRGVPPAQPISDVNDEAYKKTFQSEDKSFFKKLIIDKKKDKITGYSIRNTLSGAIDKTMDITGTIKEGRIEINELAFRKTDKVGKFVGRFVLSQQNMLFLIGRWTYTRQDDDTLDSNPKLFIFSEIK